VIGSILGCVIIITANGAFAWYKVNTHRLVRTLANQGVGMSDEEAGRNNPRDSGRLGGVVLE
jgi:hypothetical protein